MVHPQDDFKDMQREQHLTGRQLKAPLLALWDEGKSDKEDEDDGKAGQFGPAICISSICFKRLGNSWSKKDEMELGISTWEWKYEKQTMKTDESYS